MTHQPLLIPWRGQQVRVRHDDPRLTEYSPRAATIGAAMSLAGTELGLRRVLEWSVGEWYQVEISGMGRWWG